METFFNVTEQTHLFLWSCVLGVGLGVAFDMFRVARIILKHNKTAIFFEDFIFAIFFSMAIFIYSTEMARGEIHFYVIFGTILGFALYLLTVGVVVVTITKTIVMIVWKILYTIYRIFFAPIVKLFVKLCQKIKGAFVKIDINSKNKLLKLKKSLKRKCIVVYNKHTHKLGKKNRGGNHNGNKKKKKITNNSF